MCHPRALAALLASALPAPSFASLRPGDPECWTGLEEDRREACCEHPGSGRQLACWKGKGFNFERCCLGRSDSCYKSQSQFGEELKVIELLGWRTKRDGVYVEIGALDGYKYSNTLTLQTCLGWTGMLIEGSPRNFQMLIRNLHYMGITNVIPQYGAVCPPPITNTTFSKGDIPYVDGDTRHLSETVRSRFKRLRQRVVVPCRPMSWYLKALPKKHVDFLVLDVEGAELEALLTMNFSEVLVESFMIELHDLTPFEKAQSWKIRNLMANLGYKECENAKLYLSALFVLQNGRYSSICQASAELYVLEGLRLLRGSCQGCSVGRCQRTSSW